VSSCSYSLQDFLLCHFIPKFAANKGSLKTKAGGGGLSKEWKTPMARMRHAGHRVDLTRKVGIHGKVIIGPSEVYDEVLGLFYSAPSWKALVASLSERGLHGCDNGREISNVADTKILIERPESRHEDSFVVSGRSSYGF
jgi:hypothetical protein